MLMLFISCVFVACGIFALYSIVMWYTKTVFTVLVDSKHRDAELILQNGCAPLEWKSKYSVKLGKKFAKRYAMRRSKQLINYFRRTPLVDSEMTRKKIVSELSEIRSEWNTKDWQQICPYK